MNPLADQQTMKKGKLSTIAPAGPMQDETRQVKNMPPKKTAKDNSAQTRAAAKHLDQPKKSGPGSTPPRGDQVSPSRALSGDLTISHKKVGRR
jgi:hypothetical protein